MTGRRSVPGGGKTGGPAPPPPPPPGEGACSPAWRRRATANGPAGGGSPGTADGLLLRSVSAAVVAEGSRARRSPIIRSRLANAGRWWRRADYLFGVQPSVGAASRRGLTARSATSGL